MKNGFTLIEVLVGVALIGVVAALISGVLNQTFKSDTKSTLLQTVKQNGQNAISVIDQTIRSADTLICSTSNTATTVKDGIYTRIKFYNPPSSNGYIAIDNPTPGNDPGPMACNTIPQAGPPATRCPDSFCTSDQPDSAKQVITDTSPRTGVSVLQPSNGVYFSKSPYPGSKTLIDINFSLSPGVNLERGFESELGTSNRMDFSSSIEIR